MKLTRRSLRDELAFLLDSTVDLPANAYDRDTLLLRLESAVEMDRQMLLAACERARGMIGDMLNSADFGIGLPWVSEAYARAVDAHLRAAIESSRRVP